MIKKLIPFTLLPLFIGCGSSSSGTGSIDLSAYLPTTDMTKSYLLTIDNGVSTSRETYEETITRNQDQVDYHRDGLLTKRITIQTETLQKEEANLSLEVERFVDVGDTIFTQEYATKVEDIKILDSVIGTQTTNAVKRCKVDQALEELVISDIPYEGEILKIKCTEEKTIVTDVKDDLDSDYITLEDGEVKSDNDISYVYIKKGLGIIVEINDNCLVEDDQGNLKVDDTANSCKSETYTHNFFLN